MIEWVVARWCLLSCFEFVVALFPVLFWSFALVCHCVALCVCVFRDVFGSSPCVVPLSVFLCLPVFFIFWLYVFMALCLYSALLTSLLDFTLLLFILCLAVVFVLYILSLLAFWIILFLVFGCLLMLAFLFSILPASWESGIWALIFFATSDRMSLKRVAPVVHFFYVVFTLNNYVCYM